MKTFVALDFETTGLDANTERLTQIAAIKITIEEDFLTATSTIKDISKFVTYVNPEKEISAKITEITGITNETVKDAPTEKEAVAALVEYIDDSVNPIIVAQNAPFDLSFLYFATLRAGLEPKVYDFYCTRAMAAVLFPGLSHKLSDMVLLFDIKLEQAHDALHDASATLNYFTRLSHIAAVMVLNFQNKLVHHPDRPMNFKPENAIIIPQKGGK
jgi:DNA polymerase III epsilon subunit family exonuclease